MTVTIHGVIADKTGHCLWHEYGPEILNGYISPRCETRFAAYPADDYDDVQPAHLPVQIDHDGQRRGEVIYLERAHDQLYGVAVIDRPYEPEDFDGTRHYWSSTTAQHPGQPLRMTELSLTEHPASVALPPVHVIPGDIRYRGWSYGQPHLIRRAVDEGRRRRPGPLRIAEPHAPRVVERIAPRTVPASGPTMLVDGHVIPLEIRPGGRILSVR